jgi:hypothetical protein
MNLITFKSTGDMEFEYEKSRISKLSLTELHELNTKGEHVEKNPYHVLEINVRGSITLHTVTRKVGLSVLKQFHNIQEVKTDG